MEQVFVRRRETKLMTKGGGWGHTKSLERGEREREQEEEPPPD